MLRVLGMLVVCCGFDDLSLAVCCGFVDFVDLWFVFGFF